MVHAALGDPVRLRIADALLTSDRHPGWLQEQLGLRSNLLAHHINTLVTAGVVMRSQSEADRRRTYLSLTEIGRAALRGASIPARKVLFVCTHNSARSQLAQALWSRHSAVPGGSAGTRPADRIHPKAVKVAAEHGLSLPGQPRLLTTDDLQDALVVSVCDNADDEIGGEHLHWSVPDPAASDRILDFRRTYDLIESRIANLAEQIKETS